MGSFKRLNKSDVTQVPYTANKQYSLKAVCPSGENNYFNIYKGTYITGTFVPNNVSVDPITNGEYERLIFDSINHLFYQSYSGSLLNTSSIMFNNDTYISASQQRPTNSYFDYNSNPGLIENFPTGSNASIRVIAINQNVYGSKVLPYSFNLSSSAFNLKDDGIGNIYDTNNSGSNIGNIFYTHGLGIITDPNYQLIFPLPPLSYNTSSVFTSTFSPKTINLINNVITRSCNIDTNSIILYGNNSPSYNINGDGTITLNTTIPGEYDVYYTVNSVCGSGCTLTSNQGKIIVTVIPTPTTTTTTTSTTTTTTTSPTTTSTTTTTTTVSFNSIVVKADNLPIQDWTGGTTVYINPSYSTLQNGIIVYSDSSLTTPYEPDAGTDTYISDVATHVVFNFIGNTGTVGAIWANSISTIGADAVGNICGGSYGTVYYNSFNDIGSGLYVWSDPAQTTPEPYHFILDPVSSKIYNYDPSTALVGSFTGVYSC